MNTSFFGEMLQTISERGRALIERARERRERPGETSESLAELCEELLSNRGEASGVALAGSAAATQAHSGDLSKPSCGIDPCAVFRARFLSI